MMTLHTFSGGAVQRQVFTWTRSSRPFTSLMKRTNYFSIKGTAETTTTTTMTRCWISGRIASDAARGGVYRSHHSSSRACAPILPTQRGSSSSTASFSSSSEMNPPDSINERHGSSSSSTSSTTTAKVRLSKLLSQYATNLAISRRQAEKLILDGQVTLAGEVINKPHFLVDWEDLTKHNNIASIQVQGKAVVLLSPNNNNNNKNIPTTIPKVWAVHKLKGEIVTESDPHNRPSMIQRLVRGGVGRSFGGGGKKKQRRHHLKPIGRLDIPTEGLILVTNDGEYAREMELPTNQIHRVYRARVHGTLTSSKLDRIRKGGIRYNPSFNNDGGGGGRSNIVYGPMKVEIERRKSPAGNSRGGRGRIDNRSSSTNTWLRVTSVEGKNRQIRNVFNAIGVTVTRLIRIAYGDYELQTIPPGLAIQVPYKAIKYQKSKGPLFPSSSSSKNTATKKGRGRRRKDNDEEEEEPLASPVKWVQSV